jgi:hypothetical protein
MHGGDNTVHSDDDDDNMYDSDGDNNMRCDMQGGSVINMVIIICTVMAMRTCMVMAMMRTCMINNKVNTGTK